MELLIKSNISDYSVHIEQGCFKKASSLLNLDRKVLIVSDSKIPSSYVDSLKKQCKNAYVFIFKAGEKSKNIKTLQGILKCLLKNNFSRKDAVIAIGGGVSGDMGAFAASIYKRGIEFYNIPTSLLSMLDSSIGGKTAIDFGGIKNSIGSFYPAKKVLIDPELLKTLDERQFNAGLCEAIKMAATFDKDLFELIEKSSNIYEEIEEVIIRSLKIKKMVVEQDEKESGLRQVLNFGHTVGHAIEASKKGKLLHGECVSLGMMYFAGEEVKSRLENVLTKYNLPTKVNSNKAKVINILSEDKKANNDVINCIYCNEIGTYKIEAKTIKEIGELL